MGMNDTPLAERIHIGFFGLRNAGKSSLVNRIAGQDIAVVSDVKGTTTDAVLKTMELLPLGPVVLIDTPGYDDDGALGTLRVERTKKVLSTCDIAVLVTEEQSDALTPDENELLSIFQSRAIPFLIVHNKTDLGQSGNHSAEHIYVSAKEGIGIEELKNALGALAPRHKKEIHMVADFIKPGDTVVLVVPIDASAPKGRIILPQQQTIRDILDTGAIASVTQLETLPNTLENLKEPPALVITDSQVFGKVMKLVPKEIPLTSFSILLARYKGFLDDAVQGANAIDRLTDGAHILISEGCTHHRQCEDIGTVKLPRWLQDYTKKELRFSFTSGHGFSDDLSSFDLIIHCGACMLKDTEMANRITAAKAAGVPITNYGTAIAHMNGILKRSTEIIYG